MATIGGNSRLGVDLDRGPAGRLELALHDADAVLQDHVFGAQAARDEREVPNWAVAPLLVELLLHRLLSCFDFSEEAGVVEGEDCDELTVGVLLTTAPQSDMGR